MEYTRLDNMIDVIFATATDVESAIAEANTDTETQDEPVAKEDSLKSAWQFTDFALLDSKRAKIVDAVANRIGAKLIKKSRALFWDAAHERRVACSVSKRYTKRSSYPYWYAYHPEWDEFLKGGFDSYFVLGCMDLDVAFVIPLKTISAYLSKLNTTTTDKKTYWHIHLVEAERDATRSSFHIQVSSYRSTNFDFP